MHRSLVSEQHGIAMPGVFAEHLRFFVGEWEAHIIWRIKSGSLSESKEDAGAGHSDHDSQLGGCDHLLRTVRKTGKLD
jgi:hypothetical protein